LAPEERAQYHVARLDPWSRLQLLVVRASQKAAGNSNESKEAIPKRQVHGRLVSSPKARRPENPAPEGLAENETLQRAARRKNYKEPLSLLEMMQDNGSFLWWIDLGNSQ
jgi:hypothetical protein